MWNTFGGIKMHKLSIFPLTRHFANAMLPVVLLAEKSRNNDISAL